MNVGSHRQAAFAACLALLFVSGCPGQEGGNAEKCGTCDTNATCDSAAATPACVCNAGYTGNGTSCKPLTCPALSLENGKVTPSGEASLYTTASYSCDAGFKLSGEPSRKCGSDGTWGGTAPTCVPVIDGCKDAPCPHGPCTSTSDSGGYSCGPCEAGWTGANCDAPVSCPTLEDPLNGAVTPKTATAGNAATYSCQAGYLLLGEASRQCQNDGAWSGEAPTCAAVPCQPDLTAPAHGQASATTGVTGDVVTYSCDSGYSLAGNTTRLCQTDGTWSGADPTCSPDQTGCSSNPCAHGTCTPDGAAGFTCACETGWTGAACDTAVTCSGAAAPAHGSVSAASASFGGTLTYSCDGGYSLSGAATRTCQADGTFSGLAPTCAANACSPDLAAPAHGSVSPTHGTTGEVATYACDGGYALSGSTTRLCQADGAWSGAAPTCALVQTGCEPNPCANSGQCTASGTAGFTCACAAGWTGTTCADPVTCAGAAAPAHGSVSTATAAVGASVTYSCDLGYSIVGTATRACQADGSFAGAAPTCAANACAPDLAAPSNGSVSLAHGFTGDTATYGCDGGYALSGSATRLCQADGTWSGAAPTCALVQTGCSPNPCANGAACTASGSTGFSCACTTGWTGSTCASPVSCAGAAAPAHGAVSAATATYGDAVTYSCDAGYTLSGSATRACQADGNFAGSAPTCAANACSPNLAAPANGTVSATTGVTGDAATYGCDGGYSLNGAATRTCLDTGAWSGTAPTCQLVMTGCTPNPCVHSASCTPSGASGYSCGTCDAGWQGANCDQPITCSGAVAPVHGSVSAASATFGSSVTYSCDSGYSLAGSATRACQADGTFAGAAPTCAPVDCGAAPSVANAAAPAVSGGAGGGATTTFGATAAYACSAGFAKSGTDAACRANGTWSAAPTCAAIDCGAAPLVLNAGSPTIGGGVGGGASTTSGATAAYACDAGYAKAGSDPVCGAGGSWSAAPTCSVIDCGAAPSVAHAGAPTVAGGLGGGTSTTYSATAAYSCNTGYTKAGSNPVCGAGGWSAAPTCNPVDCGSAPAVANAASPAVSGGAGGGTSTTFGATAAYTCDASYAKAGTDSTCGATGSWSAAPTCNPVSCGTAPVVANAGSPTVSGGLGGGTSTTVGATAVYACDPGYTLAGSSPVCGSGGTWSAAPTCNVIDCGPAPTVTNAGTPAVSGGLGGAATTTYNATAAYSCNAGFTKAGSNATCGGSGTWSAAPTCSPVDCGPAPVVANAAAPIVGGGAGGGGSTTFMATAAYTCNANYAKAGANATCGPSGTWSPAPLCNPVNCGAPPAVLNAGAPAINGGLGGPGTTTVFATAAYTCNVGFTVKAGTDPVCSPAGNWGAPPSCNPVNCGAAPMVANAGTPTINGGAGGPGTTTYQALAAYTCNSGYAKSGSDATCQATGAWSGAPTCTATLCGAFTDVVYRVAGQFHVSTFLGNDYYPLGANTSSPVFSGAGNSTPFVHTGIFTNGFARLRFTNDATGNPTTGAVRLVEFYFPLNYQQTTGATILIDTDHSLGLLAPGLSNCGSNDPTGSTCTNHAPTISRSCASNAQGSVSGTTLTWGACTATSGSVGWNYANARGATGVGCAMNWNGWGHAGPCTAGMCTSVPACSLGDSYQTWNQQLKSFTFSSTTYKTASFTMPAEIQFPNCTTGLFAGTTTWLSITSATVLQTQCGSTPGADLVCNVQ
ncbi:MAG TPA: hypothetical protein VGK67_26775 [Myxococcales bacterium]|jgi:CUB/sushi domain-containing protein